MENHKKPTNNQQKVHWTPKEQSNVVVKDWRFSVAAQWISSHKLMMNKIQSMNEGLGVYLGEHKWHVITLDGFGAHAKEQSGHNVSGHQGPKWDHQIASDPDHAFHSWSSCSSTSRAVLHFAWSLPLDDPWHWVIGLWPNAIFFLFLSKSIIFAWRWGSL